MDLVSEMIRETMDKKSFFKCMNKIMKGRAKEKDVYYVLNYILSYEYGYVYTTPEYTLPKIVGGDFVDKDAGYETRGEYHASESRIVLSHNLIRDCLNGSAENFVRALNVACHELVHHFQRQEIKDKTDNIRAEKLKKSFNKKEIEAEQLALIHELFGNRFSENYMCKYDGGNKEEYFLKLKFAQYLASFHELDARDRGTVLCYQIFNNMLDDDLIKWQYGKWLNGGRKVFGEFKEEEGQNQILCSMYKDFEREIRQLPVDAFFSIEKRFFKSVSYSDDWDQKSRASSAFFLTGKLFCRGRTAAEVCEFIKQSIIEDCVLSCNVFLSIRLEPFFSKEWRAEIGKTMVMMLSRKETSKDFYNNDNVYEVLEEDQVEEIFSCLIKCSDGSHLDSRIFMRYIMSSQEHVERIGKIVMDYYKNLKKNGCIIGQYKLEKIRKVLWLIISSYGGGDAAFFDELRETSMRLGELSKKKQRSNDKKVAKNYI